MDFGKGPVKAKGNKDLFVMKLDPSGALRWLNTWGDKDHDKGLVAATGPDGSVYVAGLFRFTMNTPTPIESVREPSDRAPKADSFVMRLDR
jgi:hypothetical protein